METMASTTKGGPGLSGSRPWFKKESRPSGQGEGAGELPRSFMVELLLRHLFRAGELRMIDIAQRMGLGLPPVESLLTHMRMLQLVEVPRRGDLEVDVSYALTDVGHQQARLAFEKCQYVGPTPVTLNDYVEQVRRQSRRPYPTTAVQLQMAIGDLVIDKEQLPNLGSALNSGRAIYLYGPSGSGKTYLAEHLVRTLQGPVWVPHAVYVGGEVIQLFDPMIHRVVEPAAAPGGDAAERAELGGRWVRTERPVVMTGGELTMEMLELEYDDVSHLYVAPPQMKANNGIFVVDDLGRQRVSPHELLNRWIVPLDRQVDYLSLRTGVKFQVPFDATVIFSSNLTPDELTDPAFARRLGYKIAIGEMRVQDYREVVLQACARAGVAFDRESVDFLIDHLHPTWRQPYLPAMPYDIVSKIRDRSRYLEQSPQLTPALLEWAWRMYFGAEDQAPQQLALATGAEEEKK